METPLSAPVALVVALIDADCTAGLVELNETFWAPETLEQDVLVVSIRVDALSDQGLLDLTFIVA